MLICGISSVLYPPLIICYFNAYVVYHRIYTNAIISYILYSQYICQYRIKKRYVKKHTAMVENISSFENTF